MNNVPAGAGSSAETSPGRRTLLLAMRHLRWQSRGFRRRQNEHENNASFFSSVFHRSCYRLSSDGCAQQSHLGLDARVVKAHGRTARTRVSRRRR